MPETVEPTAYLRLLDPDLLATMGRLPLIARGVVEGSVSGRHKSPYRGFSVEFAEHREYVAGDNIRDLDWRIYGKSDRYYIKRYIEETNLRCVIILDASGSMRYTGTQAARHAGRLLSKFEYAQRLAAALAYVLINQQDAVGLVTFDSDVRRYIPPRSRPNHLRVILEELSAAEATDETDLAPVLHSVAERVHRRGLVILISDLFDDPEEVLKAFHHFRYRKHEVIVFHVMAEEEISFPFDDWTVFQDLEQADARVPLDPRSVRTTYLEEVQQFVRRIEKGCGQMSIDYVPLTTRRGIEEGLVSYLARRRSLAK